MLIMKSASLRKLSYLLESCCESGSSGAGMECLYDEEDMAGRHGKS